MQSTSRKARTSAPWAMASRAPALQDNGREPGAVQHDFGHLGVVNCYDDVPVGPHLRVGQATSLGPQMVVTAMNDGDDRATHFRCTRR